MTCLNYELEFFFSPLNYYSGDDEKSRSQRMHIYTSLLKQMAPEHLLATFAKVCAEILAAASDGTLKVENAAELSVLQVSLSLAPSLPPSLPPCCVCVCVITV